MVKSKILICGIAGFIGSNLAKELDKLGYDIYGLDNLSTGKLPNITNVKCRFFSTDITDFDNLLSVFESVKPDYVFHLAALPRIQFSLDHPVESFRANVLGVQNVLECARLTKVKKVIYSSSSSVYGDQEIPLVETMIPKPISLYALHKYMGEKLCEKYSQFYKLQTACLRYFNVYGPNMDLNGAYKLVIAIWKEQLANGQPVTIFGDGEQTRDFTHVKDVVTANIKMLEIETYADKFNVGSGVEVSMNELASYLTDNIVHIENPREFEEKRKRADITKLCKLGWKPTIFIKEGIKSL